MKKEILESYGFFDVQLTKLNNGLINDTWIFEYEGKKYIAQRINDKVFSNPYDIDHNMKQIGDYLEKYHPDYTFPRLIKNLSNETINVTDSGYYRVFAFIEGSIVHNTVKTIKQAFEAAYKFGEFTWLLKDFPLNQLNNTLPDFHNLSHRYNQFLNAIDSGNKERTNESKYLIDYLKSCRKIVTRFEKLKSIPEFRLRATHHDTKISNVLFNDADQGISVIDLDTLMPGYFISDVGDMIRTYVSESNEEEKDFSLIKIREEYFKAIVEGYLSKMKTELSEIEKEAFVYAGKFMIYMQALRFLTDYLNNDKYYGFSYKKQNLVRAENQCILLQKLSEKENILKEMVRELIT